MNKSKTLEKRFQQIEDFINTPVKERPKYKEFYERVKQMAEQEQATEYEPKWMRESYVWMANRATLLRIQQEESEEYLRHANYMTKLGLQLESYEFLYQH